MICVVRKLGVLTPLRECGKLHVTNVVSVNDIDGFAEFGEL